jgi:hypothetical protein
VGRVLQPWYHASAELGRVAGAFHSAEKLNVVTGGEELKASFGLVVHAWRPEAAP